MFKCPKEEEVLTSYDEFRNPYIDHLKSNYNLDFDDIRDVIAFNNNTGNLNIDKISKIKEKIVKNIEKVQINSCINFSDEKMIIIEISNNLLNQILRRIVRKEYNSNLNNIYFSKSISSLVISIRNQTDPLSFFAFFIIYLLNFIKIRKVVFSPVINAKQDLYSGLIMFDYLILNDLIESFIIKTEYKILDYNISIFDVLKLKSNLKKLTIHIPYFIIDVEVINKVFMVNQDLEKLVFKDAREIKSNNEEFLNFITFIKERKKFNKLIITSTSKFILSQSRKPLLEAAKFNMILFDLMVNKDFKKLEISDAPNLILEENIQSIKFSESYFNKKEKLELTLLANFTRISNFHFINFNNLKTLDVGLLDYISLTNLIKSFENVKIRTLILRLSDDFNKIFSTQDEIVFSLPNIFNFINNPNYNIKKFYLLNCNFDEDLLVQVMREYLIKDKKLKTFCIKPYNDLVFMSSPTTYIYDFNKKLTYYSTDKREINRTLFLLKMNKIYVKNKNIIDCLSSFSLKENLKSTYIESRENVLLVEGDFRKSNTNNKLKI